MAKFKAKSLPIDPELQSVLDALPKTDGTRYTWRFRAEREGVPGLPFIGEEVSKDSLPVEEVGKHVEKMRQEFGLVGDVVAYLHAGEKEPVRDAQGRAVRLLFKATAPAGVPALPTIRGGNIDPDIAESQRQLDREKAENRIREERIRVEQNKKRLDALEKGEKPPGGEADDSRWPFGPGVPYKVVEVEPGVFAHVRMYDEDDGEGRFSRRRSERKDPMELFLAMMSQQQAAAQASADRNMQLLTALLTREDPSTKLLLGILPVLTGDKMKLPELMAMFQSMNKGQEAAMKATMEFQSSMMEKTVDRLLDSDKPSGPVETAKEIMGLVKEGAETGVKAIFGRSSIINPDAAKAPPLPPKKQLPPKATVTPLPNPPQAQLPAQEAAKPLTAAEQAVLVAKARCAEILTLHEREMLVGSAPRLLLSTQEDADKLLAAIDALPSEVQDALDAAEDFDEGIDIRQELVAKIYDALKIYQPELVDGIFAHMADPAKGEARRKWSQFFWQEIVEARRDGDEEGEPEPEPEAPAV